MIEKDRKGRLNTSVMYNSVYRVDQKTYNSVQNRTTKYNGAVQLSGTKINKEIKKHPKDYYAYLQSEVSRDEQEYCFERLVSYVFV